MQLEIITIGDELLLGFTIDTNAAHLARELAALGIRVVRRATVGDTPEEIASAVREALHRTGRVITTGGLGPTADDLTKPAIAGIFGRGMLLDEAYLERLRERWRGRGWGEMPESNRSQALIPEGARVLVNRHGTAPGIMLEDERQRWVAMLPGVPREMRGILREELLPLLRARVEAAGEGSGVVLSRTLRTTGVGESRLAEMLGDAQRGVPGMPLASLPGWEGTDLRLTARAASRVDAERQLDAVMRTVRERSGEYVYGEGADDLAAVVLERCRARGLRIAVAESCTGGMLGARLTAIAGSSDVVLGGIIAYHDDVKQAQLDVPARLLAEHGAVSEQVARAMATGVRARFGAGAALSITGIAGPGGGSEEKPVGTVWTAVDVDGAVVTRRSVYVGDRAEVRQRAAQGALDMLRRALEPASAG